MEDGFPLFNPNDEAARQEQKLREYYDSFSANARKRLMSKTIVRPSNVYDVLYNKTRELLLSKNIPFKTDLEEDSKIIRDRLIAKIVVEETDLEKISADFRKSLLARAKIQEDKDRLLRIGSAYRNNLIAKNSPKDSDIEKDSAQIRNSSVAKNKPNPSIQDSINKSGVVFRERSVAKNVSKEQDLLKDSESFKNYFRKNDIHKNVPIDNNIEKDSESFRKNNLSKNSDRPSKIDETSEVKRLESISKNNPKSTDIENDSIAFRVGDLSKNSSKEQDILKDSESIRNQFRKNNINKNTSSKSDIKNDGDAFRKSNISKNVSKKTDLEDDSNIYRNNNTNKGVKTSGANIEEIADEKRAESLSRNVNTPSDIEFDSEVHRTDDLSKNTSVNSDIERDSEIFRSDDLSLNKSQTSDIEVDSVPFRDNDLSFNKPNTSDLESDSTQFRADNISVNTPNDSDIEKTSTSFRANSLSFNNPIFTDLEKDSDIFRENDLSFNIPKVSDIEVDSVPFRVDDLSKNTLSISDLETDSIPFRDDDMSFNVPNFSDLETDSTPFRVDDLAANILSTSDLDSDSVPFRVDDLSANVPNTSDLIVDSAPFLSDNLSSNVPSTSDLDSDSAPFRVDDLSANVPNTSDLFADSTPFRVDDLSANVPGSSNIEVDSASFRADDLATNVSINSSIISDSIPFRDNSLSSNVPSGADILMDSDTIRKNAIAKNSGFGLIGANLEGAGTSSFLGVSRVFTQGIILRQLLLSKNKPNESDILEDSYNFRVNNLHGNTWVPQAANAGASLEYGTSNTHFNLLQGSRELTGSFPVRAGYDETGIPSQRNIIAQSNFYDGHQRFLQFVYGNTPLNADGSSSVTRINIGDQAFYTDRTNPKGGGFDSPKTSTEATINYSEGYVTENIRLYNIERNSFNIKNVQVGGLDGFGNLQSFDGDEEFQALVSSTIGSLNVRQSISTQGGTNTTPLSVIIKNGGRYFPGNGDLLRPGTDFKIGSAESMMAKTSIGNPFEDEDFLTGKRGVKHIINTIKNSDTKLASNYDPQTNRTYIVGANRDGSARVSRQRYTINNPYAPQGAGKLVFSIKNYASQEQLFFPPYIDSIQNTENASWNSTNFLGRPEAVYTYNNSSRNASISFYVLTDYSQNVDIGRDWGSDSMDKITAKISKHFTQSDKTQNDKRSLELEKLRKLKAEQTKTISDISRKVDENAASAIEINEKNTEVEVSGLDSKSSFFGVGNKVDEVKKKQAQKERAKKADARNNKATGDELEQRKKTSEGEAALTEETMGKINENFNRAINYSESNNTAGNVYNINIIKKEFDNGDTVCKPEDTIVRINTMKKNLMFQPAFFSGDKVDFVRKIEFLSKLTRPSAAPEQPNTGFSFTKPPVCHIHLGDWWNHDIIVNSVSFDYAEAPWTLDNGRVQPMWALVSIDFNIIGPYGSLSAAPVLSTDKGGMYSPIKGV